MAKPGRPSPLTGFRK
ncbi:hypothetical protein [uncultured Chryseobacterium sp.]